mmetsp:Transcript_7899/g.24081  ORF Transcript_7899/g.24081 Transcript_7899/m.24081 type:complete len:93 (-) Transcript_7899:335-613(-)
MRCCCQHANLRDSVRYRIDKIKHRNKVALTLPPDRTAIKSLGCPSIDRPRQCDINVNICKDVFERPPVNPLKRDIMVMPNRRNVSGCSIGKC